MDNRIASHMEHNHVNYYKIVIFMHANSPLKYYCLVAQDDAS